MNVRIDGSHRRAPHFRVAGAPPRTSMFIKTTHAVQQMAVDAQAAALRLKTRITDPLEISAQAEAAALDSLTVKPVGKTSSRTGIRQQSGKSSVTISAEEVARQASAGKTALRLQSEAPAKDETPSE